MSKYILSVEARQELKEIREYIARDDAEAADRWIFKLRDAFRTLAQNPQARHSRKDLTDMQVRLWPVGRYLIIYQVQQDSILILAVTQGSRDIPSYLRPRT